LTLVGTVPLEIEDWREGRDSKPFLDGHQNAEDLSAAVRHPEYALETIVEVERREPWGDSRFQ
jgi:hypothetical protein